MPDFSPPDFLPRARLSRTQIVVQLILDALVIGWFLRIGCETRTGTISRIERRPLPRRSLWSRTGSMGPKRYAALWFDDAPDMMVGYAFASVLHETRAGHSVTIRVSPDSGHIRALTNHTKKRRWWQH